MPSPPAEICDVRSGSASHGGGDASADFPSAREAAWSRAPSAIYSTFGGGISILHLGTGQYFRLEDAGAHIWNALARPVTIDTIATVIAADYSVDQATAEATVASFIENLRVAGLVVTS